MYEAVSAVGGMQALSGSVTWQALCVFCLADRQLFEQCVSPTWCVAVSSTMQVETGAAVSGCNSVISDEREAPWLCLYARCGGPSQ